MQLSENLAIGDLSKLGIAEKKAAWGVCENRFALLKRERNTRQDGTVLSSAATSENLEHPRHMRQMNQRHSGHH